MIYIYIYIYINGVLVGWLVGFYGISTFVDYLMPNQFNTKITGISQWDSLVSYTGLSLRGSLEYTD